MRVEGTREDELISRAILAAQKYIEQRTGLLLSSRRVEISRLSVGEGGSIFLPWAPIERIEMLTYFAGGQANRVDEFSLYDGCGDPEIILEGAPLGFGDRYSVEAIAGFKVGEAPEDLRQAVIQLAAHLSEYREIVLERAVSEMPHSFGALLDQRKRRRIVSA